MSPPPKYSLVLGLHAAAVQLLLLRQNADAWRQFSKGSGLQSSRQLLCQQPGLWKVLLCPISSGQFRKQRWNTFLLPISPQTHSWTFMYYTHKHLRLKPGTWVRKPGGNLWHTFRLETNVSRGSCTVWRVVGPIPGVMSPSWWSGGCGR